MTRGNATAFETALRDRWAPALAREDGVRLAWCARTLPGAITSPPEFITMTAVEDGPTIERLGLRVREGDLVEDATALGATRRGVTRRVVAPLSFNPYEVDLGSVPLTSEGPVETYIHDFVPARQGMQRTYEDMMKNIFVFMLEAAEGLPYQPFAGLETVAGGGTMPENVMITKAKETRVVADLVWTGNPRGDVRPGTWMYDALKVRDTWVSRLVQSLPWSPTR